MNTTKKILQDYALLVCAFCLCIDGLDLYIVSVTQPFVTKEFALTNLSTGLMQAMAPMASIAGALLSGGFMDKYGRKPFLIYNSWMFLVSNLVLISAQNYDMFIVGRAMIGFTIGLNYPLCASYFMEVKSYFSKNTIAAFSMFLNNFAAILGVMIALCVFNFVHDANMAWRMTLVVCAIPSVLVLSAVYRLPETPMWLANHKKNIDSVSIWSYYVSIFQPSVIKNTFLLAFSWFIFDISFYGLILFTPKVLEQFNIHGGDIVHQPMPFMIDTLFENSFAVFGSFASLWAIKKYSLIQLQWIGYALAGLGLFFMGIHSVFGIYSMWVIFFGFAFYNFFINIGPGLTTYLLPAVVYSTNNRATGHGFCAAIGKLGAFLGTLFLPSISEAVGPEKLVIGLGCSLFIGTVLSLLMPKTTN
jgi:MFS transporter, putative metabolite transport protein